jgi:transposase, IS5 family
LYADLIRDTEEYADAALFAASWLEACPPTPANLSLSIDLRCRAETALRVIVQTERRVFEQESVPSQEKTVSLFHPEVDILCKRQKVVYGHKLCLSFGQSGLVLAAKVLQGNPADATLTVPSIKAVKGNTGKTPKQTAMDGGFASRKNLQELKEMGVEEVGFSKGRGMSSEELCGNKRKHTKLRRFRAGVEGLISWLKRTVELGRVRWKGEAGFRSYVWGAILTASLRAVANAGTG